MEKRTDAELAEEIRRRGLEREYLLALAAEMGRPAGEGLTDTTLHALEKATLVQRRRAAGRAVRGE